MAVLILVRKLLKSFFAIFSKGLSVLNAWFRASERKENEISGINKMKVAQNEEYEKNRKDAKDIGGRKHTKLKSNKLRRVSPPRKD